VPSLVSVIACMWRGKEQATRPVTGFASCMGPRSRDADMYILSTENRSPNEEGENAQGKKKLVFNREIAAGWNGRVWNRGDDIKSFTESFILQLICICTFQLYLSHD